MGAFQLPDSVIGAAVACLLYSFVCLAANVVLVWLIWTHHERTSYVAWIAYFTLLATTSSIVQQLYDYSLWRDIMTEQFYHGRDTAHDAETQYQKGLSGLKLALSYLRIFANMVESSLVFFFSLSLAATVYGWWANERRAMRNLSLIGRTAPVALAILSIILLQLQFTHDDFIVYFAVANVQYILSLVGSCIFLLMILFRYVQSRRQLKTWATIQYGQQATSTGGSARKGLHRSRAMSDANVKAGGTTDNWLVIRLTIAFLTLGVFEWTNIASHLSAKTKIIESTFASAPDLSESRAMATVTGYLSGVSPSMLAFLVFGTTKSFQRKMYARFVPLFLRRQSARDDAFLCRDAGDLPYATFASKARSSTVNPPQPTKSRSISLSALSSQKASDTATRRSSSPLLMMPTQDTADVDRVSQIGLAFGGGSAPISPAIPATTFFRDQDTDSSGSKEILQIPVSRFIDHDAFAYGHRRAATMAYTTTTISSNRSGRSIGRGHNYGGSDSQ